jgi:hypothetical protein
MTISGNFFGMLLDCGLPAEFFPAFSGFADHNG